MALLSSILTGGVNNHPTTSEEANAWSTDFISEGIVGSFTSTNGVAPTTGAFSCNAQGTPDMTIAVSTGVAYVQGTPTSQNSQTFRIKNTATENVTISANSSGSTKYDWVYIKLDAAKLNGPNVAGDDAATLVTSRSTSQSTDDGTPPTYGYPIAVVTVANGAVSITNGNIRDSRANCIVNLGSTSVSSGWNELGLSPNTVTANGNRSYDLVFNSTDITSSISSGMLLKLPRTVTPPTQCTDLESSSSQYYSKSSPAGMTFTDDFVVSAWVKLESYPSSLAPIASRYNGTSGWYLSVTDTGTVVMKGFNGGASNVSQVASYRALPLNKWVHVAVQLDMSSFTATTTTSYVMINGVDSLAVVSRGGTNPTALVQPSADLQIGKDNTTNYFDGKIAQVAIYSAKVTQATILASINQTLAGNETSLISAYSFNNTINDLSANANNLTAQNSAVATSVDSPFNSTEYARVTSASFSTNTTVVVRVPNGYSLPTSGGISPISYSTHGTPFGAPTVSGVWEEVLVQQSAATTSTTATLVPGATITMTLPAGKTFRLKAFCYALTNSSANSINELSIWDGTPNSGTRLVSGWASNGSAGHGQHVGIETPDITLPATATKTYNVGFQTAGGTTSANATPTQPTYLKLEEVL